MAEFPPKKEFDYIFAGGGMAALSMAFYLNQSSLRDKSMLIIDKEIKNTNDHTYCFWGKGQSAFEPIICQKWNKMQFFGANNFTKLLDIEPFSYKMIKADDFYHFVKNSLKTNINITFLQAEIIKINSEPKTLIETTEGQFEAKEFIFDSVFRPSYTDINNNNLWQHFKGYLIKTSTPTFNIDKPTLFDFRIDQQSECRFMYVLPTSETQALVEFTIFSEKLLEKNEYDLQIKNYLTNHLKLTDYEIVETEFGVIPMSDEHHVFRPANKVIRIGTAGGFVKASTGYSFQRTQVFLQKLVENLEKKAQNLNPIQESRWKKLLDSTLLNVMKEKRIPQNEIFTALFKNNKASRVLEFLNEETTLWQDIKLMNTVPKLPFIKSAVVEIKKLLLS